MQVLIQMAMRAEAEGVIARLGLEERDGGIGELGFGAWEGGVDGHELALVTAGVDGRYGVENIGPVAAAVLADRTIERWQPGLVINAGTSGGFAAYGAAIGDVYLGVPPVVFHDRRVALPGFDAAGVGSYPCVDGSRLAQELGLKSGVVSTGSSIDLLDEDLERMMAAGARVKEMEAGAAAWVCWLRGVDLLLVKAVTDLVDGEHAVEEEFVANLALASERLAEAVERVVGMVGKWQSGEVAE